MSFQAGKPYLFLLALALMTAWLAKLAGLDQIFVTVTPPGHSADYFSTGYSKFEMDKSGRLDSKLTADKMVHYSDDQLTHLENPVMFFYNENTPPWEVKSESGILSADGNDLTLNGKVSAYRPQAANANEMAINTRNAKVKIDANLAESSEWTELLSKGNRTTGKGMKLLFSQPVHIELLADVRGKYDTKE
ncbi:MAG: LPS export ABC transporter periplasmic protein LptC [Methylobacter sp.]|nr:MAG: LPS export ABC transporter periplasmic protein LptC [Methylobacter sp.]